MHKPITREIARCCKKAGKPFAHIGSGVYHLHLFSYQIATVSLDKVSQQKPLNCADCTALVKYLTLMLAVGTLRWLKALEETAADRHRALGREEIWRLSATDGFRRLNPIHYLWFFYWFLTVTYKPFMSQDEATVSKSVWFQLFFEFSIIHF